MTAFLCVASALALAETWTGKLIDASCADQQKNAACAPSASTSSFALQTAGKVLKLDAEGNKKASAALKESNSEANRAKDPNAPAEMTATVTGALSGEEIKVESIQVR
jgi:hypothetical protein